MTSKPIMLMLTETELVLLEDFCGYASDHFDADDPITAIHFQAAVQRLLDKLHQSRTAAGLTDRCTAQDGVIQLPTDTARTERVH